MALRGAAFLLAYLLVGLFYTLSWYPILLNPFWPTLLHVLPRFGFLGLALIVGQGLFEELWFVGVSGKRAISTWRPHICPALLVGLLAGNLQIIQQVRLIARNPYLTLDQYLREDLGLIWIALIAIALLFVMVMRWDSLLAWRRREARRAATGSED